MAWLNVLSLDSWESQMPTLLTIASAIFQVTVYNGEEGITHIDLALMLTKVKWAQFWFQS